jgi:hypothetical protein
MDAWPTFKLQSKSLRTKMPGSKRKKELLRIELKSQPRRQSRRQFVTALLV